MQVYAAASSTKQLTAALREGRQSVVAQGPALGAHTPPPASALCLLALRQLSSSYLVHELQRDCCTRQC